MKRKPAKTKLSRRAAPRRPKRRIADHMMAFPALTPGQRAQLALTSR